MLHNVRTTAQYEALPTDIKAEYKKTGDDAYTLQHDADTGSLTRALDRERTSRTNLETQLNTVEAERDTLKLAATKVGTPAQIAAATRAEVMTELKPQLDKLGILESSVKEQVLTTAATTLARAIGGTKNEVALMPHVSRHLDVTLDAGNKPVLVIKDKDGKASARTLADLEKDIRADTNLSSLVVASRANGAAIPATQVQSPAVSAGNVPLSKLTGSALVAAMREKVESQAQA